MTSREAFAAARRAITYSWELKTSLCAPFLATLPVTGASVSVLSTPAAQTTMFASDDTAAFLDELQFDLGEGPGWEAMASRRPVFDGDVDGTDPRWPLFTDAVPRHLVRGIFAFPLVVGQLEIGAVDLYSNVPRQLSLENIADATTLARATAWQVLRRILADDDPEPENSYSRREVHQATGMVLAQLDVTADDAILLLRAHAFSSGRSVREIANEVVERRLEFESDET
jgi:hypothetical protein